LKKSHIYFRTRGGEGRRGLAGLTGEKRIKNSSAKQRHAHQESKHVCEDERKRPVTKKKKQQFLNKMEGRYQQTVERKRKERKGKGPTNMDLEGEEP